MSLYSMLNKLHGKDDEFFHDKELYMNLVVC